MNKFFVTMFICAMACQAGCGSGAQDVTYSVKGDAIKVTVSATESNGWSTTTKGVSLPWEKKFSSNKKMALFLSVVSEEDGAFTAQILIDGVTLREGSGSKMGDRVDLEYVRP